jgi:hypothetical protein
MVNVVTRDFNPGNKGDNENRPREILSTVSIFPPGKYMGRKKNIYRLILSRTGQKIL